MDIITVISIWPPFTDGVAQHAFSKTADVVGASCASSSDPDDMTATVSDSELDAEVDKP